MITRELSFAANWHDGEHWWISHQFTEVSVLARVCCSSPESDSKFGELRMNSGGVCGELRREHEFAELKCTSGELAFTG